MKKLNKNHRLFTELTTNPPAWWQNLISSPGVYIEIRKNNSIDVYYHGGSIVRELKFNKGYSGSVHYKYLPTKGGQYVKYSFDQPSILLNKEIPLLSFSTFDKQTLKKIKSHIAYFYPATSEKGIQANFINQTGGFIDSEFAYNYNNVKLRIDLVWVDTTNKKIIFVELKTMGDTRLYNHDIYDQLKKYQDFAQNFSAQILHYYQVLFSIKKKLNLLPKMLKSLNSLAGYSLEERPLLLFGDCEQKWIDNEAKGINSRINKVACGAYYFGGTKYNCNLIPKTKGNRYIFPY